MFCIFDKSYHNQINQTNFKAAKYNKNYMVKFTPELIEMIQNKYQKRKLLSIL